MNNVLSIIIPTYKRFRSLLRTLDSLRQYPKANTEIIIVDQSPDNISHSQKICQIYPHIQFICHKNPNLPQARNIGIQKSHGSIVLFIDDDVIIHPSCLCEHIFLHTQKNIDAVAGRIVQNNPGKQWEQTVTVATINRKNGETKGNFDLDYNGMVAYASGGHMSIKKKVFHHIGLFNNRFIGNFLYEDVEFFSRMRKNGYKIYYSSRAIVYHYPKTTGGCHESRGHQYQLERLHNQALYFLLHIRPIPSLSFLVYMKNLIEYISRNENRTHNIPRIFFAVLMFLKAYQNCLISIFVGKKLFRL